MSLFWGFVMENVLSFRQILKQSLTQICCELVCAGILGNNGFKYSCKSHFPLDFLTTLAKPFSTEKMLHNVSAGHCLKGLLLLGDLEKM